MIDLDPAGFMLEDYCLPQAEREALSSLVGPHLREGTTFDELVGDVEGIVATYHARVGIPNDAYYPGGRKPEEARLSRIREAWRSAHDSIAELPLETRRRLEGAHRTAGSRADEARLRDARLLALSVVAAADEALADLKAPRKQGPRRDVACTALAEDARRIFQRHLRAPIKTDRRTPTPWQRFTELVFQVAGAALKPEPLARRLAEGL